MAATKVIAALLACAALASPPVELRVMSFNIRYGTADDGPDSWPNRRAMVIDLIRREAPEILGLQEALRFQLDEIRAALPRYGEVGVGRDDGREAGEYAAILYDTTRLELLASGTFWFSDTPEVPGSRGWGNSVTRIATWARLRDRASGGTFRVYNVHLDHESQPSRERSAALLLERIGSQDPREPAIVTGDFNAGEDNPAVAAMRAAFTDSYRERHPRDPVAGTFNAFRGDSDGPKVDYVFVPRGTTVLDARIVRWSVGGRYPSDHFPVSARIRLDAAGPPGPAGPEEPARAGAMEAIVVSATRIERRVEDQPLRVEVVEPEEVQEKVAMTPGDISMLLNETGGLRVQNTNPGLGGASVRIHGLRGRYTQVLADGLPLYGPTGSLGLLQIPPMDLLQVEIVKGPASAMYGGAALGGLVNLVSRRPAHENELLLNATTLGGKDAVLWFSRQGEGRWGWTFLGGAHFQSRVDRDEDGWTDVPEYQRLVLRPRVHWEDRRGRSLLLTAGLTVEDRTGGTEPGAQAPDGSPFPQGLRTRRGDVGFSARALAASGLLFTARGSLMLARQRHRFGRYTEDDGRHAALAEVAVSRLGSRITWLLGAAATSDGLRPDSVPRFRHAFTAPAAFGQLDWTPSGRVAVQASGRLDLHSEYGAQASPRVSALWRFGRGWSVRLSGGAGYFAPTPLTEETEVVGLREVRIRDPLQVETGWTASGDLGGVVGPLEFNATLFRSAVADPVDALPDCAPPLAIPLRCTRVALVNDLGARHLSTGADVVARWRRAPWHVTASYAYVRVTRRRDLVADELSLNPRHAAGIVASWESEATRIGAELYYVGRQLLTASPERTARDHLIAGMLFQRRLGNALLFVNLENIGDARMTRWQSLVRPAYSATSGWAADVWAPLEGRVVNAGVRLRM